jgi:hypothetical protein
MPQEAYSTASDLVTAARPPLVSAVSAVGSTESAWAAMLALMLTTWPPCCFSIWPMAHWVSQKNPARLTPTTSARRFPASRP